MVARKQDFDVPKGDDIWLDFDIDPATLDDIVSLNDVTIYFAVAQYLHLDPDEDNVLLEKNSVDDAADFEILNDTEMTYRVKLKASEMAAWDPGIYFHQSRLKDASDVYVTTTVGTAWIDETV